MVAAPARAGLIWDLYKKVRRPYFGQAKFPKCPFRKHVWYICDFLLVKRERMFVSRGNPAMLDFALSLSGV